jgi:uncharacterized repeat protein (TIGR03803 family)
MARTDRLAGLTLSGATLYGTASQGGNAGDGTIFSISTNGADFANLYSFFGGAEGSDPEANLTLAGNTLYSDDGSVFALNLNGSSIVPIALNIQFAGDTVILNWNDPAGAFSLQASDTVVGGFTNVAGATSPFTNVITGSAQFFRLAAQP